VPDLENLRTIAEIAIAVAGFSGVVVAFRPASRPWTDRERLRFRLLVLQSVVVLFFCFLPLLLAEGRIDERLAGRLSNGALAMAQLSLSFYVGRRAPTLRGIGSLGSLPRAIAIAISCSIALAQAIHAFGGLPEAGPFLYMLSLLFILAMSLGAFLLLSQPSPD
jgi:hypothetical protein